MKVTGTYLNATACTFSRQVALCASAGSISGIAAVFLADSPANIQGCSFFNNVASRGLVRVTHPTCVRIDTYHFFTPSQTDTDLLLELSTPWWWVSCMPLDIRMTDGRGNLCRGERPQSISHRRKYVHFSRIGSTGIYIAIEETSFSLAALNMYPMFIGSVIGVFRLSIDVNQ